MKLKRKNELRRFSPEMVIEGGIEAEISNRTKIARSASHVELTCEVCGVSFTRKASEAKRHAHAYCGRGCLGVAQRREVHTTCKVCGKPFRVKASSFGRVVCCSDECRSKTLSERTTAMDIAGWRNGVFPRGEVAPGAKLSEQQALAILSDSRGNAEIARDYGVDRHTVRFIKIGKTWAHLKTA